MTGSLGCSASGLRLEIKMAAMGLAFWGMLTVENTPENAGRSRQKRARLAPWSGEKIAAKTNAKDRLTNQSIS
jgi:hypothetical protein